MSRDRSIKCPACGEKTADGEVCNRCCSLCTQCLANARYNLAGGNLLAAARCRDYCFNGHRLLGQYTEPKAVPLRREITLATMPPELADET